MKNTPSSLFTTAVAAALVVLGSVSAPAQPAAAPTALKFSFAPGAAAPGFTSVPPDQTYSKASGFGFEPGAALKAVDEGGAGAAPGGFVTSEKGFYFSANVPEGNYKVTVTLGDAKGESVTTVKAELRRLMLEQVRTEPGKFETRTFIVNVRVPQYPGGQVKLKSPRETTQEAWGWDNRLTLEFSNSRPCLRSIEITKVDDVPTVFILGDSTVCDQSGEPFCSWGQMLTRFFKPEVAVANHAESGETVASSAGAGRLKKVLSLMKPGDYLLMQYGHNDMKNTTAAAYGSLLKSWVAQVQAKGGIPVLITPMNRHTFQGDVVTNSLKDFPDAVRTLAAEQKVALIDLNAMSKTLYEALGPQGSINLFEHVGSDLSKFDATHHCNYGAYELARCIVEGLKANNLPLAKSLFTDVPAFNPAHPDPVAEFKVPPSSRVTTQTPLGS